MFALSEQTTEAPTGMSVGASTLGTPRGTTPPGPEGFPPFPCRKDVLAVPDSTDLQRFPIPGEGADLRVLLIDGEPWLVAVDVARVLGYRDAATAVRSLKPGEIRPHQMRIDGIGLRGYTLISESGFYRLVMRSNRPEADAFQTWVTAEVLPSIRKTGGYGAQLGLPRTLPEALRAYAEEVEAREQAYELLAAAKTVLDEAAPKVEQFDTYMSADGCKPVGVVAQELGMGQNRLFEFLRQHHVLIGVAGHRFNTPYQAQANAGRFVVKAGVRDSTSEGTKPTFTTMVTPKGEEFIYRLVRAQGTDAMRAAMDRVAAFGAKGTDSNRRMVTAG